MKKLVLTYSVALVSLIFSLTGCGKNQVSIEPELQSYVSAFEADRGQPVTNLIVEFQPDSPNAEGGECDLGSGTPTIKISKNMWDAEPSDIYRKFVMYHELGHCVLGRGHVVAYDAQGYATSIMYPDVTSLEHYRENWDSYVQELFQNAPSVKGEL